MKKGAQGRLILRADLHETEVGEYSKLGPNDSLAVNIIRLNSMGDILMRPRLQQDRRNIETSKIADIMEPSTGISEALKNEAFKRSFRYRIISRSDFK